MPQPTVPADAGRRQLLAVLSAGAGAIHVYVIPEHLEEFWPFGVFFAVVAAFQTGWAYSVRSHLEHRGRELGVLVNAALVAVWLLSRTVGLPIGPAPWQPERVGVLDVLSALLEISIVLLLWSMRGTAGVSRRSGDPEPRDRPSDQPRLEPL